VLTDACRALQRLASAGRPQIRIAINLPPSELADHSLAAELRATCARFDVAASLLELEITEGSLINNIASASETLHRLRRLGATIALDDFGTGYSSLSYLHQFPLQALKIDRSFVAELTSSSGNSGSNAVVRAILALAGSLGMQVIAEGIESEMQRDLLQRLGCEFGQGFLFGHPEPASRWLGATV